jgi:DNA-binding Xre family transcriptional regulator
MGFKTHLKTLIINRASKTGDIITQKQIHEATGISQATLSRWFQGDVDKLDHATTLKLAEYFQCELCDLISLRRSDA